ncbi:MAG: DNA-3-methyladenine glycosylase I [Bacteroidota bacterium]
MLTQTRCPWAGTHPLMQHYHDQEWGVPLHNEHALFELLTLEGAQAGLSWSTVLNKRERYREVFEGFDPVRVARFRPGRVEKLMKDPGIIRNRLKIESTISNAKAFLAVQDSFGSFDNYLWNQKKPTVNHWTAHHQLPASTPESDVLSRDLKKRGFRFVGSTICYAFMQACGLVDDHLVTCWKRSVTS